MASSTSTPQTKVVVHRSQNRLEVSFAETITRQDLNSLYTDIRFCLSDLDGEFDVISDFSASRIIQLNSIPVLRRIMNYLIAHGVREVIRIIQADRLIYRQFLNLALHTPGYKPAYVATREEADNWIAMHTRRQGIRLNMPDMRVDYRMDEHHGQGKLVDISISGCAVRQAEPTPQQHAEILITFPFSREGEKRLTLKAMVVRAGPGDFAVRFTDISSDEKEHLWNTLLESIQP